LRELMPAMRRWAWVGLLTAAVRLVPCTGHADDQGTDGRQFGLSIAPDKPTKGQL
jgi:hypothetical protein